MAAVERKNSNLSHVANLLTSILLCYPEIAAINLDSKTNLVRLVFYISTSLACDSVDKIKERLRQSMDAYYFIMNKEC